MDKKEKYNIILKIIFAITLGVLATFLIYTSLVNKCTSVAYDVIESEMYKELGEI